MTVNLHKLDIRMEILFSFVNLNRIVNFEGVQSALLRWCETICMMQQTGKAAVEASWEWGRCSQAINYAWAFLFCK